MSYPLPQHVPHPTGRSTNGRKGFRSAVFKERDRAATPLIAAVTAIDHNGRLADGSTVRALGWPALRRVSIRTDRGVVLVTPSDEGSCRLTGERRVRLPTAARRYLDIASGDRMLVVADPDRDLLVVYPITTLFAALSGHRPDLWTASPDAHRAMAAGDWGATSGAGTRCC